ncbi:MAG TPA: hypothetical protein VGQ71_01005 [Terriglobales bacterium]|jgi:O-antigen/teichoic acid export membrane protein|nr:hypothetical protein [Terriglobales bacterium]
MAEEHMLTEASQAADGLPPKKLSLFNREFSMPRILSWGARGGLAIAEYGLISGSNFVLGILLARWMSAQQFGAYALAFSLFLLLSFAYQSLLLEPMSVFGGSRYRDCVWAYFLKVLCIAIAISLLICLVFGVASGATWVLGSSELAGALLGLSVAAPCICLSWLVRRVFYLRLTPGPAAAGALLYFVIITGGVVLLHRHALLSPATAFLLMAAAALLSSVLLLLWLLRVLPRTPGPSLRETWQRHWQYGRWSLGTAFLRWLPNYIYFPLLATFFGMAPAGELRALTNFTAPVDQTATALTMLLLPYAAGLRVDRTPGAASNLARRITLLFVAGAALYWLVIIPFAGSIFHAAYDGNYLAVVYLMPLVALESVIWSAGCGPAIVLRSMESPASVFAARCVGAAVCLLIGIPATRLLGVRGAVLGMLSSSLVSVLVTALLLRRKEISVAACAQAVAVE